MKPRITTRAVAITSIAALTLATPVSAFAATSHTHPRPAAVSRFDRSPDRGLHHDMRSRDRSVDRTQNSPDLHRG
jgi:hypothetical protein